MTTTPINLSLLASKTDAISLDLYRSRVVQSLATYFSQGLNL